MPKTNRTTAAHERTGPVEEYTAELPGGYTVNFMTFHADIDGTPLLRGMPDDTCQCPHWGYVFSGRLTFRTADGGEEVFEAGDAFYLPPGHIPQAIAGTEYVQLSPSTEVAAVKEHMMRRTLELMAGGTV
jgi:hypothetical protein